VEPEIIDIILFLQKMGALITVEVDRTIIIEGVPRLSGASHRVIPDRMEAASYAIAAVATNGRVFVEDARQEHMIAFLNNLRRLGGEFIPTDRGITFFQSDGGLRCSHVETDVYPGFMTDWQQPFVTLMTQARGVSILHETVYEDRFGYTKALRDMGADIQLSTQCLGSKPCRYQNRDFIHSCIVTGATKLRGKSLAIPDLRAGVAFVVAGLAADGVSDITEIDYLERGYAAMGDKLLSLGAHIEMS
jgi:UDP-N-acetylglucosamine 1-carboxyvinyltransferase